MGGYTNDGMIDDGSDILDFLSDLPEIFEEGENNVDVEDWESLFQSLGPIPLDILEGTCKNDHVNSLSNESSGFQTPSPNSVLDSKSSCSRVKTTSTSTELVIPVRTRMKRPRHSTTCKWHLITLPSPNIKMDKKVKEKKKRKIMHTSNAIKDKGSCSNQHTSGRICSHCQVTQTPQWRTGPLGPNTLCNACGVRYRAGRLVPEYRPAASPTFVPSLHSNFHRRVVQMRNKSIQEPSVPQTNPAIYSTRAESFPADIYSTKAELFPVHVEYVGSNMVPEAFVPEQHPPAMSPPVEFVPMSSYLFDHKSVQI